MSFLETLLAEHVMVLQETFRTQGGQIEQLAHMCKACLQNGGKIMLCGNGGSAADAQHIAAEFVGRFKKEREGWAALALTVDTSILTAIGNDYGYDLVFARQVEALGRAGDVLIGLSTSGSSKNVVKAAEMAKQKGVSVVVVTGSKMAVLHELADLSLQVQSTDTARIQEATITMLHGVCEMVEG